VLAEGETVLIDMGLVLDGYCSDMTRTVAVGEPDPLFKERLRIVRQAQLAAIKTIRAGIPSRDVDLAARRVIGRPATEPISATPLVMVWGWRCTRNRVCPAAAARNCAPAW